MFRFASYLDLFDDVVESDTNELKRNQRSRGRHAGREWGCGVSQRAFGPAPAVYGAGPTARAGSPHPRDQPHYCDSPRRRGKTRR